MKKHTIQIRRYHPGQSPSGGPTLGPITGDYGRFELVETVQRTIRREQIGNFCPMFATYQKAEHLVHSDEGDLSDPFRAEEYYLNRLFIKLP